MRDERTEFVGKSDISHNAVGSEENGWIKGNFIPRRHTQ